MELSWATWVNVNHGRRGGGGRQEKVEGEYGIRQKQEGRGYLSEKR